MICGTERTNNPTVIRNGLALCGFPDLPADRSPVVVTMAPPAGDSSKKVSEPSTQAATPPATGKVSFFSLFRFADGVDKVLYTVGFLAAAANGVVFPAFTFISELMSHLLSVAPIHPRTPDSLVQWADC